MNRLEEKDSGEIKHPNSWTQYVADANGEGTQVIRPYTGGYQPHRRPPVNENLWVTDKFYVPQTIGDVDQQQMERVARFEETEVVGLLEAIDPTGEQPEAYVGRHRLADDQPSGGSWRTVLNAAWTRIRGAIS